MCVCVVCCVSPVVLSMCYELIYCLLHAGCRPMIVVRFALFVLVMCGLCFVGCSLLFVVDCVMLVVCCVVR